MQATGAEVRNRPYPATTTTPISVISGDREIIFTNFSKAICNERRGTA